ncbi:MAG: hypothetical protein Q8R17_01515 [bacterium]|nr:hypothetical protein [bacterium]
MKKELTAIAIGIGCIVLVGIGDTAINYLSPTNTENSAAITTKYGTISETISAGLKHLAGLNAKVVNVKKRIWAGHEFETGILKTGQYKTDGNTAIQFSDSGWYAPSYSLPRSTLLDVNLNQKNKVRVSAIFEGEMKSKNTDCTDRCITTESYHFSEFGIYLVDESGHRQGMRVLGTRHNIVQGNSRTAYKFTELTLENTGTDIILTDSTGFVISYSADLKYVSSPGGVREENKGGSYGVLNPREKWRLGINCHVNGEGYCKLNIKEVIADK